MEFNPPVDAPTAKQEKQLPGEKRRGGEQRRNQFVERRGAKRGRVEVQGEWEKTDGQSPQSWQSPLSLGSY